MQGALRGMGRVIITPIVWIGGRVVRTIVPVQGAL